MKPIHSMIRVLNRDISVDFYQTFFQLEVAYEIERETFSLIYLRHPLVDFELELTVNKGRTEAYAHGEAYGHLAFCCQDFEQTHQRFHQAGLNPTDIKTFEDNGKLFARFFFVQDPDGYKIEIIEQSGRFTD